MVKSYTILGLANAAHPKPPVRLDFGKPRKKMIKKKHINYIHPGKLTWNLKMNPWKKEIPNLETIIFRFYVSFRRGVILFLGGGKNLVSPNKNNNQNPGFLSFPPTIHPRILKTRQDTTRGRRRQGSNERPFTRSSPSIWNTREVNCLLVGCPLSTRWGTESSYKRGLMTSIR